MSGKVFTASNGLTVGPSEAFDDGIKVDKCPLSPAEADALREFFRAEEDERLGRWRDSDTEEWRVIPGYDGYYEVSSEGRVRSVDRVLPDGRTRSGKILRQCTTKGNGRLKVSLSRDGVAASVKVHQIVARAFLGSAPEGKHMVLHNDGNHLNNNATNLRWGNNSDNMRDSVAHGTWRNQHTRDAHPEPKPWHEAKHGEGWLLTVDGDERVCVRGPIEDFIHAKGVTPWSSPTITAGRRIWPEVQS